MIKRLTASDGASAPLNHNAGHKSGTHSQGGNEMTDSKTTTYRTTDEIRTAARVRGSHFFDPAAMRFFRSRIGLTVYGGQYFITSEQSGAHAPRRYTIRRVISTQADFDIRNVGDYGSYASTAAAAYHIKTHLLKG